MYTHSFFYSEQQRDDRVIGIHKDTYIVYYTHTYTHRYVHIHITPTPKPSRRKNNPFTVAAK